MPEHVHLLLKPRREEYNLAVVEQVMKQTVAERVINALAAQNSPLLSKLEVREKGKIAHRFWQKGGGHDLNIWTMKKAIEKAEYCHRNPVARRLVKSPEQWYWSSFRWLELGRREGEPFRVDDWDETLVETAPPGTGLKQPRPVAPL